MTKSSSNSKLITGKSRFLEKKVNFLGNVCVREIEREIKRERERERERESYCLFLHLFVLGFAYFTLTRRLYVWIRNKQLFSWL